MQIIKYFSLPLSRVIAPTCVALALACMVFGAHAREGIVLKPPSAASRILLDAVPAQALEASAAQEYAAILNEARQQSTLLPAQHPQVQRVRAIGHRVIEQASRWNPRAAKWQWDIQVIKSEQINAFCMPGGKIVFYTGIIDRLNLNDDEIAVIMGHEVAHALREHARENIAKTQATGFGLGLVSQILGLGDLGNLAANVGTQLLSMKYGRENETEADLVGIDLAARAGYNPRAGISLWKKMSQVKEGEPPEFLSTHPSSPNRIQTIEKHIPLVMPLYERTKPKR